MEIMKKCPHCGGAAILRSNYSPKMRLWFVFVKCTVCSSQGKPYTSEENPEDREWNNTACNNAITAWNMRYQEPTPETYDNEDDWEL